MRTTTTTLKVSVDGKEFALNAEQPAVSVELVEPGVYSVLVGRRSFDVRVDNGRGEAWISGRLYEVLVEDPRELSASASSGAAAGRRDLIAPMPGKVIRLLVAEGEGVTAGQGVIVVEAMKMQNEMPAPKAGRVTSLRVGPGDSVAAGQVLATVE